MSTRGRTRQDGRRPVPEHRRIPRPRRLALAAAGLALALLAGCANFASGAPSYTVQPSLSAPMPTPVVPQPVGPGDTPTVVTTPGSSSSSASRTPRSGPSSADSSTPPGTGPAESSTSTSTGSVDPCLPTDPAVIAACLTAPWGLVPLADGMSALVGERTTGRILLVAYQKEPVVISTVTGIDAAHGGGLLGIAVSPSYAEDGLIYAYVTTATDNRIIRIAQGDQPKPIFTGIPKGVTNNGGPIVFNGRLLYVGTGDTGRPLLAASADSLAGKVLRLDEFGKPAGGSLTPGSPIYASGLTQPTGMCLLPNGVMGVVDHRQGADLLLAVKAGKNYQKPVSGDAAWTWKPGDGGAADCAYGGGQLVNTSLPLQKLTGVQMSAQGTFSGSPAVLLEKKYGRLLTVEDGPHDLFWMTTSNKDGAGKPVPADDRVIVLLDSSGGGNGPD